MLAFGKMQRQPAFPGLAGRSRHPEFFMRRLSLLALLALIPLAGPAMAADPEFSWMTGNWRQCTAAGSVEEHWLGPAAGVLVGANLTMARGKPSFEYLRIVRKADGGWALLASPNGKPPTAFPLVESGPGRAVFANGDHDFPNRVIYARDGADLVARIEGKHKGQDQAQDWRFVRIVGEGGCAP
jgi:hypothetical protein